MTRARANGKTGGRGARSAATADAPARYARSTFGGSNAALQAKLRVGPQDDPLERQADRAAEAVMAGRALPALGGAPQGPQRMCAECESEREETIQRQVEEEEEEELVQPKADAGGARAGAAAAAADAIASGGRPLSGAERAYFEPRFGHDFSTVRLHDDSAAHGAARDINARAFTLGSGIAFAHGEHRPETVAGRRLLAHELAHVVQQRKGAVPAVRRSVAANSACPANVHGAPNDPLAEITSADARAQTMVLGTSHLLFIDSILFRDPTLGPGEAFAAYERRFGRPERTARGRFRNRFTGNTRADENDAIRDEMVSLSDNFEAIHQRLSGDIRYRCPGTSTITVGGCRHRCGTEFAWNCAPANRRTIALCPAWWTGAQMGSTDQKAANIVHEGSHLQFTLPQHRSGNQRQRGVNSECYEALAADIYGVDAEVGDCPPA